ncbi:hypothetical protein, conserved [Entamoeba dispar SAW760]|uniref:CYRIA/CYRIB Rac1 binding domain-containing protein n=1 Tax=Entamoeba dispar (strain ATCC PRA-260 / SAW760) TaxID=370354 RepID=B0EGY3_ENTDS|nr:uncharacterized protein EDI_076040 [Entamoeba dispar SAW760]EDR26198.1 hypothetical protein, conserved [Entamoeba dispar SAW760]|eukprot:EDR26198.1 hypothetical protein, conserved [Entamoeba dispar SAW760]
MGAKHSKIVAIPINFSATPSAAEQEPFQTINEVTSHINEMLQKMTNYKAKETEIRAAIATPSPETEEAAWKAIVPQVQTINSFFEYSRSMKIEVVKSLRLICKLNGNDSVTQYQAVTVKLMELIDFAVQFDNKKLANPGLQNDFSYYRRSVGKMKQKHREDVVLRDEVTNQISMFFAFAAPMILCLCEALNEDIKNGLSLDNLGDWLRTVAYSCCTEAQKHGSNGIQLLRIMTGCILLYDTVVPTGAFSSKGKFNVLECVRTLQTYQEEEVALLANSLKYSTKHFNDEDTPKNIKVLLL